MISGPVEVLTQNVDEVSVQTPQSQDPQAADSSTEPRPAAVPERTSKVQPKRSLSLPVWLAVTLSVLGALWWQTNTVSPNYNFLIEADADAEGAQVVIDGQNAGNIVKYGDSGIKIVGLRLHVLDGEHTIEIVKPGYRPFKTHLAITGADYLNVQLSK